MALSDDLPPQIRKGVKRKNRKRRSVTTEDVETLLSIAARAAHIARDKGYYVASPEAIRCVQVLRMMRSLPLTDQLIKKTYAMRTIIFLATNDNPKIRFESETLVKHLKSILRNGSTQSKSFANR